MTPERSLEVERLYHAVLGRRAQERAAFLRNGCAQATKRCTAKCNRC